MTKFIFDESEQSFDKLPQSVAYLIKEVSELKSLLINKNEENPKEKDTLMTPKETAKLLDISLTTLWRWEKKGRLKCYAIGGTRYYKRNEVLEALTLKK